MVLLGVNPNVSLSSYWQTASAPQIIELACWNIAMINASIDKCLFPDAPVENLDVNSRSGNTGRYNVLHLLWSFKPW